MAQASRPIIAVVALLLLGLGVVASLVVSGVAGPGGGAADDAVEAARYVGRAMCVRCHPDVVTEWTGSHHDLAMQEVTDESLLGDWGAASLEHGGVTSMFSKRDGKPIIRTDGPDGELADFEVAYLFGVAPLQQLLISLPGGRLQAPSLAWDARPAAAGGQRWFHLYPDEPIDHRDELHWTGRGQRWNLMCAECHSTRLEKGYDRATGTYETRWFEIDVSCEACHGPGGDHVDDPKTPLPVAMRGAGAWKTGADGIPRRVDPIPEVDTALETCGPCHARRSSFGSWVPGDAFLDGYRPALLEETLYFADGQIQDEVYVWGSFLQSKMHAKGVTCGDCHEPHGLGLRAEGNGLCLRCHSPELGEREHTLHDADRAPDAVLCVNCHAPERTYMVVDPRRDHAFRVPRPDLTEAIGAPNACTSSCHDDRDARWAAKVIAGRAGGRPTAHWATALDAGRRQRPGADEALARLVESDPEDLVPGIVRATAASLLGRQGGPRAIAAIGRALRNEDPLVRHGAARALGAIPPERLAEVAGHLVEDPVRAVRLEAVTALAALPEDAFSPPRRDALASTIAELRAWQRHLADDPSAHVSLSILAMARGDPDEAEAELRAALRLDARHTPAAVNLADLMRATGRDLEAVDLLHAALAESPRAAVLHHALGLLRIRLGQAEEGRDSLRIASGLAPEVPRFAFVYAVALQAAEDGDGAVEVLREAARRHPGDIEILHALVTIQRDAGRLDEARRWARRLVERAPWNGGFRELQASLDGAEAGGRSE